MLWENKQYCLLDVKRVFDFILNNMVNKTLIGGIIAYNYAKKLQ